MSDSLDEVIYFSCSQLSLSLLGYCEFLVPAPLSSPGCVFSVTVHSVLVMVVCLGWSGRRREQEEEEERKTVLSAVDVSIDRLPLIPALLCLLLAWISP